MNGYDLGGFYFKILGRGFGLLIYIQREIDWICLMISIYREMLYRFYFGDLI